MGPALIIVVLVLGLVLLFVWLKLLSARRAEFIREFSLPPGIYDKLRERHPDLSLKDCQLVGHALRQFFLAYLKSGLQYISMPSQVVDDLWHEFILYTRHYEQFCKRAFGGFLHHMPAATLGAGVHTNDGLRRCWWQACREEHIHPQWPTRLPLLFALDRKLQIKNGFLYVIDCRSPAESAKLADTGLPIYCAGDLKPLRKDRSGSSCSGGGSSCGADGGGHGHGCSGSGCSGGCGGGGD